jgi:membrane protein DedA with SNARE-associated domain
MPVKIIEFAAGVFEMKPFWFFGAIFAGKFLRFFLEAVVTIVYGPAILKTIGAMLHEHLGYVLAAVGVLAGLLIYYMVRKLFGRRGTRFPVEDQPGR